MRRHRHGYAASRSRLPSRLARCRVPMPAFQASPPRLHEQRPSPHSNIHEPCRLSVSACGVGFALSDFREVSCRPQAVFVFRRPAANRRFKRRAGVGRRPQVFKPWHRQAVSAAKPRGGTAGVRGRASAQNPPWLRVSVISVFEPTATKLENSKTRQLENWHMRTWIRFANLDFHESASKRE